MTAPDHLRKRQIPLAPWAPQEREYGLLSEGKPTRQDGSASRLAVAASDPSRNIARRAATAVLAISFDHFVNRGAPTRRRACRRHPAPLRPTCRAIRWPGPG